jgi:hypothetical protein
MLYLNKKHFIALKRSNALKAYPQIVVLLLLCAIAARATVRDNEILYIGGTAGSVPNGTKGRLSLLDKDEARFVAVQGAFEIPYQRVTRLGYGEKVSRRILEGLAINIALIFSKRHQHFLTVQYLTEQQASKVAVFEIGKDNVHSVVNVFENRTRLNCEFESNQAERDFRKTDLQPKQVEQSGGEK